VITKKEYHSPAKKTLNGLKKPALAVSGVKEKSPAYFGSGPK